jgi:hypothetical protein
MAPFFSFPRDSLGSECPEQILTARTRASCKPVPETGVGAAPIESAGEGGGINAAGSPA